MHHRSPTPRQVKRWQSLPGGWGLDIIVARWVMGWSGFRRNGHGVNIEWASPGQPVGIPFPSEPLRPVPAYSRQIEAAWCVVERMRVAGFHVNIMGRSFVCPSNDYADRAYDVEFGKTHPPLTPLRWVNQHWVRLSRPTIALAICAAALEVFAPHLGENPLATFSLRPPTAEDYADPILRFMLLGKEEEH